MSEIIATTEKSALDEFRSEVVRVWGKLPGKGLFFGLLAAWVLLFEFLGHCSFNFTLRPSLFSWMYGAYNAPALDSSHGTLIPFVVLTLLWLRREDLLAKMRAPWWPALVPLALSLALHVVGYVGQQPRISIIGLFTGIFALMGLAWGWRVWLVSLLPFCFFVFSIPFGNTLDTLTFPLRMLATTVTYGLMNGVLGFPLVQEGTQLIDRQEGFTYDVAAACSGIHSLIPLLALTTIYATMTMKSGGKRFLIILTAVPLALICNILRLIALVFARKVFGESAGEFVHDWFGFVTYGIALGTVLALGSWLAKRETASMAVKLA